jgi:hypothetical protein
VAGAGDKIGRDGLAPAKRGAMKIERILLCYDDGDKIIVNREADLVKYDLSKVSSFEATCKVNRQEFDRLRGFGQIITAESSNVEVRLGQQ